MPYFELLRIGFLFWLFLPRWKVLLRTSNRRVNSLSQGATVMYQGVVRPILHSYEAEIDHGLAAVRGRSNGHSMREHVLCCRFDRRPCRCPERLLP